MFKQSRSNEYMKGVNPTSGNPEPMVVNAQGAAHVTAPVTVGTAAQLVTATGPLGPNDAGRLFYDTTEAIAGGIGWQVWNGGALVTDYTYVTQATLLSGEDQDNDVLVVEQGRFEAQRVTTDTLVSNGVGFLHTLTFCCTDAAPTAGSITVYDNTAASGTVLYLETFTTTAFRGYTVTINAVLTTGLYIDFTTTADVGVTASGRFV